MVGETGVGVAGEGIKIWLELVAPTVLGIVKISSWGVAVVVCIVVFEGDLEAIEFGFDPGIIGFLTITSDCAEGDHDQDGKDRDGD